MNSKYEGIRIGQRLLGMSVDRLREKLNEGVSMHLSLYTDLELLLDYAYKVYRETNETEFKRIKTQMSEQAWENRMLNYLITEKTIELTLKKAS